VLTFTVTVLDAAAGKTLTNVATIDDLRDDVDTPISRKVRLHFDGDTTDPVTGIPDDMIGASDETTTIPGRTPTRDGYIFKGWSRNPQATTPDYNPGDPYTFGEEDETLYAIWERIEDDPNPYTIIYRPGTTDKVSDLPLGGGYFAGDKVVVGNTPRRSGYRFLGYEITTVDPTDSSKFITKIYQPGEFFDMPAANLVATALWKKIEHKVVFDSKGGTPKADQTVPDGKKAKEPTPPKRPGYNFDGWYTKDGKPYDFSKPVTSSMTLYAHWRKKIDMVKTGDSLAWTGLVIGLLSALGIFGVAVRTKKEEEKK